MIYRIMLLLIAFAPVLLQAQVTTEARLEAVTVYRSGAEMSHKAHVSLPAGSSELTINNVASNLDENSIRVGANANITIVSLRFNKDYLKTGEKNPAYFVLADSIKKLNRLIARLDNEEATEESVLTLIQQNGYVGKSNTGSSVTELMKMADYYRNKQLELKNHISDLEEKISEYQKTIKLLSQQQLELGVEQAGTGGQLVLQVIAKSAAVSDFDITYISPGAGWTPFYELRAPNTTEPLKLSYKANVAQNTGIDWKKVKLVLSTGNPSVSNTAPSLLTWLLRIQRPQVTAAALNDVEEVNAYGSPVSREKYVGAADVITAKEITRKPVSDITKAIEGAAPGIQVTNGGGQPGSGAGLQVRGRSSAGAGDAPLIVVDGAPYAGDMTSIDPATVASMTVLKDATATNLYGSRGSNGVIVITTKNKDLSNFITTNDNELNATFDIDIPYDIASNARPHTVALQEYKLPASYKYYAVPKADGDAFLMAHITGYEKLNLLPGNANIIFENMFIGKTILNPVSVTDTLSVSMGRDKKITIKREQVAELTTIKNIGNSRKQTYTYEIKVRNGKKEAIEMDLKDQYPVSADNDLEIELLEASGAEANKETGILTWKLNLASGETKTLRLSYSVKFPKSKLLANL